MISPAPTGRSQPFSEEAEGCLLSCCLLDGPETMSLAMTRGVDAEAFYVPHHRLIWNRLMAMLSDGKPIDLASVAQELITHKELEQSGGYDGLVKISRFIPTTSQADYFAEKIAELASLRKIIAVGTSLVEDCYAYSGGGVAALASPRFNQLFAAVARSQPEPEKHWDSLIDDATVIADSIIGNNGKPAEMIVDFPWRELSQRFQPMERGQLVVLAARPSVGKSSLVRPIAVHAAQTSGPVYFVTLEVNPEKVPLQMAATASGIGLSGLGRAHGYDQALFKQSLLNLKGMGIAVSRRDRSMAHIISRAKSLHAKKPLSMIVIDHGGQVEDVYRARLSDKIAAISQMTKTLKALAGELNCVIVLLWQLNRSSAKEGNREPQSFDLRDSGSLEEDADKVILIHRPSENPITGESQSDNDHVSDRPTFFQNVIQSKGRDDGTAIVSFSFKRETATFIPIVKAK
jgi:replicative DNA helicase